MNPANHQGPPSMACLRIAPRWRKILADLRIEKERAILMFSALAASLVAVATILGAWQILSREIRVNYLGTVPAQATLEIGPGIDRALLERVRSRPEVAVAEARDVLQARVQVGDDWVPLLVFVGDSLPALRQSRVVPQAGAWPAPAGSLLLERTALPMLGAAIGGRLNVRLPGSPARAVTVAGTVHDAGLSPASQERMGYAYLDAATLSAWGADPAMHELRLTFSDTSPTMASIEARAGRMARDLRDQGVEVHEIRVPPYQRHPHQAQMETVILLMLAFAILGLVLGAILVATILSAWLARQGREIAILKAIGARSGQIGAGYISFVAALGLSAFAVAWPTGTLAARVFATRIAAMLNFGITDGSVPWTNAVVGLFAAVLVPILAASVPVARASRRTVRAALSDWGTSERGPGPWQARLPRVVRQAVRRPARLALSLGLLAASGAIFLGALSVRDGWIANLDKIWQTRHYDLEVRFRIPQPGSAFASLRAVPGVVALEGWGWTPGSLARRGEIDLVHVWPDKGHGSFSIVGAPTATKFVSFPLVAGRRLTDSDSSGTVFNHIAWAQAGRPAPGSRVDLGVDGRSWSATLVGVVEEVGSPGIAYLTPGGFDRFQGTRGAARMVRVATSARTPAERTGILRALEAAMAREDLPVQMAIPFSELRTAIGDHIKVLVTSLLALAGVIGLVGMLGLASITGMGVIERTREFGVLKALGGTPGRIQRMVLAETLFTGGVSGLLGVALAWPLTLWLDRWIGSLGFLAPLPMVFRTQWVGLWMVLVLAVSLVSAWIPARRASRQSVREALATV